MHGNYTQWLRERRADGDALRGPENQLPHDYVLPQAWRTALPEELYPTSYVVERTLAWLDGFAQRKDDAPFFLQCSFPDPHHPFTPPGPLLGHVQARRHGAAGQRSASATGRSRRMSRRCTPRATTARASATPRRPSR